MVLKPTMCFGVPAKVISAGEKLVVEMKGITREVIPMCPAKKGDSVLITQGVATSIITAEEAFELENLLNGSD